MARLDVYATARGRYVLDVQASLLDHLHTRVVVPLIAVAEAPPRIRELNPLFEIDGNPHVMVTQALATMPRNELRRPVQSLDAHHDEITRALDILLMGF